MPRASPAPPAFHVSQAPPAFHVSQAPRKRCARCRRMRAGPRRRAGEHRQKPAAAGAAAPSCRPAGPGPEDPGFVPGRADPRFRAFPPQRPPAAGRGDRRAEEPGARSAAGTGGQASARRSARPRSPARRSWAHGSWARRSPVRRSWGRCPACHSAGRGRRDCRAAARSVPAAGACVTGPAGGNPAVPALPRGAASAGRTRRTRCRSGHPGRWGPRRRLAGRRGDRPGVYAWAGQRHRGPGRYRHVPPGTSWTLVSSRAAGHALPHECRSGEIPCRTGTANCHQLHIIRRYCPDNSGYRDASSAARGA
jgi:hypothetical protein